MIRVRLLMRHQEKLGTYFCTNEGGNLRDKVQGGGGGGTIHKSEVFCNGNLIFHRPLFFYLLSVMVT